jgi:hypothetical protein
MRVRRSCRGRRVWLAASHAFAIGLVVGATSLAATAGPVSTPTVPAVPTIPSVSTIPPSDSLLELPTVPVSVPGRTPETTPTTSSPGSGAGGSGGAANGGAAATQGGGSANTSSSPGVSPDASGGVPSVSGPSGRLVGATRGAATPRRATHRNRWPVAASLFVSVVSLAVAAFCTRRRWQDTLRRQWRRRFGHRRSAVASVSPTPGAPRLVTGETKSGARLGGTPEQGATLDPADAAAARDALTELATRVS